MEVGRLMELLRSLEKMRGCGSVTRPEWPPLALREPARPWVSGLCGLPSSRPSSIFSTPRHRFGVVHGSGVSPGFLGLSGLTLSSEQNFHYSRVSIETTIAHWSGVRPFLSGWSGLMSSRPSSNFTIPSFPYLAALWSGVSPSLF